MKMIIDNVSGGNTRRPPPGGFAGLPARLELIVEKGELWLICWWSRAG